MQATGGPSVYNAKIIIMGEKEVGKTSIIQTYMTGRCQDKCKMTNTCTDHSKLVDVEDDGTTTRLKLKIWDVAGDGNLKQLAHLFARDVQVAILVYSINSMQSFKSLCSWQERLEETNEDFLIFLVGNKSDLEDQRAVPFAMGEKRKRHTKKCEFFTETSAFTQVEPIMDLFDTICKSIVRKKQY